MQETLMALVNQFKGKRVVTLADLVADRFLYGEIARISREAPVLIINHHETKQVPGGGANAIHNIWAAGGTPYPIGVVGQDQEGEQLIDDFKRLGIDTTGIESMPGYRTPTKMRVIGGLSHGYRQQIVRIDWGKPFYDPKVVTRLRNKVKAAMKQADILMVSDYGYGAVSPEILPDLSDRSIPTILDSRFALNRFLGVTAALPNQSEVEAALGVVIGDDRVRLEQAGRTLMKRLKQEALVITRGKEGMALFERRKKTVHIPVYGSDQVADVTGAGDTVMAIFTLAVAAGGTFEQAARLANYAGGLVVMKHGTCTVTSAELLQAVRSDS